MGWWQQNHCITALWRRTVLRTVPATQWVPYKYLLHPCPFHLPGQDFHYVYQLSITHVCKDFPSKTLIAAISKMPAKSTVAEEIVCHARDYAASDLTECKTHIMQDSTSTKKIKCKAGLTSFQILPIKQDLINILYPVSYCFNCVIHICIKCNLTVYLL